MVIEEQEKHIYERLRQEREKLHLSQFELSLEAGVSQNMIAYIENGKRTPSISTILKLCNAMKIDPSVLFLKYDAEKEHAKQTVLEIIQKYM
ncbi:helix-turn-helix transcriptional regulator [Treponema sp.]|uniref:helix-turn-helix domain-containing protein n=1 Tax=Treponema sp. TaxID=166 RepID=UPI0025CCF764|nr:helix-turn-helix transcriptional regulator [Treponema sp.]MBR4322923.1 helix-turn-helix transcriptional regulator [Treponema sp.]